MMACRHAITVRRKAIQPRARRGRTSQARREHNEGGVRDDPIGQLALDLNTQRATGAAEGKLGTSGANKPAQDAAQFDCVIAAESVTAWFLLATATGGGRAADNAQPGAESAVPSQAASCGGTGTVVRIARRPVTKTSASRAVRAVNAANNSPSRRAGEHGLGRTRHDSSPRQAYPVGNNPLARRSSEEQ